MNTLLLNNKAYNMPSEWNELTAEAAIIVVSKLQEYEQGDEDQKAKIKTEIALSLSELKLPEGMEQIEVENGGETFFEQQLRTKLLPLANFIFEQNTLTKQLLPKLRIRKNFLLKTFYGPADNFANLSMGEFDDAEFFFKIITDKQELTPERIADLDMALNMLCAILYREYENKKGDNRVDYHHADNDKRAAWFARCDYRYKALILFWYIGCRNSLVNDFKVLFEGGTESKSSEVTWTELAHSLAGPVLGDIDKVFSRPVRQVFTEMKRLHNQAEEMAANNPDIFDKK